MVNFKGNRAQRHACASSNICRMAYAITEWSLEATTKTITIGLFLLVNNIEIIPLELFHINHLKLAHAKKNMRYEKV
jgi:hypothetical protein